MRRVASIAHHIPAPVRRVLKHMPGAARAKDALTGRPRLPSPEPGTKRPVVYLPTWATWDDMRQRPQFIIEAFSALGHPVYFVDPREATPRIVGDVTIVPTLEDTPHEHVILYLHFAPNVSLVDRYDDAVVVYDILDDLSIYEHDEVGLPESRRVRHHHPTVIRRADVVMASAPALVETHRAERPDILLVENGVDVATFGGATRRPGDIEDIPHPIVGYHGMIARWFDFDLISAALDRLPGMSLVLVGPHDPAQRPQLSQLTERGNVHYLGPKASDDIAAYVQSFDVGLVPFVVDELTRAVSPLKMYEYMAGRVPVVATPLPVCVDHPLVATAGDPDGFAASIREAVDLSGDGTFGDRLELAAREAAWVRRLQPIVDRLDERELRTVPG
jgi:glycosyltransferase involved in cell wall biosynthesis